METFVYSCADVKELKKVLEGDTLSDHSFTRLGYVLREGKPYGVPGYLVYFKVDASRASVFTDQLKAVPGCEPVAADVKKKVVDAIEAEENAATAGFGSLFG